MSRVGDLIMDQKIASGVSIFTISVGFLIDLIPDNIGKLAAFAGLCLSLILAHVHLAKRREDKKRNALECELLKKQIDE